MLILPEISFTPNLKLDYTQVTYLSKWSCQDHLYMTKRTRGTSYHILPMFLGFFSSGNNNLLLGQTFIAFRSQGWGGPPHWNLTYLSLHKS